MKAFVAALGVPAVAIAPKAGAQDTPSLRYAIGSEDTHSLSQLPTEVAQRTKLFDRAGVRVQFVRNSASNSRAAEQGYNPSLERMTSFKYLLEVLKESGVTDQPLPPAEKFVDLSYATAAGAQ
jgi:hypothetical protein